MNRLFPLPRIMVAPNGARRTKADHPALPITIAETVATAAACHRAGAGAIHAHVRDDQGKHVLDAGLYAELIAELRRSVPRLGIQITTEAVGIYTAAQQRALLPGLTPDGVSIGLTEMMSDGDVAAARRCYHALAEAGIATQHILYDAAEVATLGALLANGTIPANNLQLMLVLGRYTTGQQSDPSQLSPYLEALKTLPHPHDWALCAFGQGETACLAAAFAAGGKARVGFENSIWNADGSLARDNAERVAAVAALPHTVLNYR